MDRTRLERMWFIISYIPTRLAKAVYIAHIYKQTARICQRFEAIYQERTSGIGFGKSVR